MEIKNFFNFQFCSFDSNQKPLYLYSWNRENYNEKIESGTISFFVSIMQSNTLNFTISIFVTVVPSMALRNLMIMTLKRLNQGQTRLLLFQACVSIRRLSSQCFNSIGIKSSLFHQNCSFKNPPLIGQIKMKANRLFRVSAEDRKVHQLVSILSAFANVSRDTQAKE